MGIISMDKIIKCVLNEFDKHGFIAYLVGGYVRDSLLGVKTFDVDICTSALPKDIHAIFNIASNNYGGANIKLDNYNIDITTFRKENNYQNRHPEEVVYITDLKTDLERRDFTINAIVMDKTGKIVDLLDGVTDLNNRLIKMIGNPFLRLKEDPLRILRAIRLATVLDFAIDEELMQALKENYMLVESLSGKRIREELDKILSSSNYKKGLKLLEDLGIDKIIGLSYSDINYTNDLMGMYSQVKVANIPFTNNEKSNIIRITEVVNKGVINYETLFNYGLYINIVAGTILNIDTRKINQMYKKMPIKDRSDIVIDGNEIMNILDIKPGKVVSDVYSELITEILSGRLKNKKGDIKKYLLKRK